MLGHREMSIDDYLAIARRRKWLLVIPAIILPIIAYTASLFIADVYTSRTLVLVEQQKVPDTIVQSVVGEDIAQRLATMQEQILSRSRLQPIIEKFGLYQGGANSMHMEDKVEALRAAITIEPVRFTDWTPRRGDARVLHHLHGRQRATGSAGLRGNHLNVH